MRVDCGYSNSSSPTVFDAAAENYARRFYRIAPLSTIPQPQLGLRIASSITNGVEVRLQGVVGLNYQLQASDDLLQWFPLTQVSCTNTLMWIADPDAAYYPQRFYRALLQ